jgi:hypothetical protein
MHNLRLGNMTQAHKTAYTGLSSTGQSLATIAAGLAISLDDAEKRLSLLIDEALASRTVGGRSTALYSAL